MDEMLKTLCEKNGLSGDETQVREYIKELITPYCKEVITDNLGNLIAYKEGKKTPKHTIMYDAHMDETGYYVKKIGEDGLLYFDSVGVTAAVTPGKTVTVYATAGKEPKYIDGVIGLAPIHLTSAENRSKVPKISEMCIDIGAKNRDDAEKYVSIADSVYFKSEVGEFGSFIKAKALDDRVGCYVLIKMIMSDLENSAWFSFSVQEEVGCRGTQAAAYRIKPDYAVMVEGTTAGDIGNVEETKSVCHVGEGVSISFADNRTVFIVEGEKDADTLPYHKIARAANRRIDILYEYTDGSTVFDDLEDPLPFDINAQCICIKDEDYALWYRDITDEPQKYEGKTVCFKAQVAFLRKEKKGMFAPGRFVMTCCVDDIQFCGLPCKYENSKSLTSRSWVMLEATISAEKHPLYHGEIGPVLTAVKIVPADPAEQEVAEF